MIGGGTKTDLPPPLFLCALCRGSWRALAFFKSTLRLNSARFFLAEARGINGLRKKTRAFFLNPLIARAFLGSLGGNYYYYYFLGSIVEFPPCVCAMYVCM